MASSELGGSQISALLETVPGIASVLRSPVADALVNMIRAGAGVREFDTDDARELIQYAVRRGLIGADEGDQLEQEVLGSGKSRRKSKAGAKSKKAAGRSQAPRQAKKASKVSGSRKQSTATKSTTKKAQSATRKRSPSKKAPRRRR